MTAEPWLEPNKKTGSEGIMMAGFVVPLAMSLISAHMLSTGDHARELRCGDQVRNYLVHIPPSYQSEKPAPVVLVFHSAMMNASSMARFCGLSEKADQAGFVVVYANGTGTTPYFLYWDAGGVRGKVSDDVGYVSRLLDDLETVVNVDARRVFATGMSNGAMMCYRLASELSPRIAAIAPVAGTMAIDRCNPARPVPVMHFHGTKDGLVLYGGPDERTPKNIKFLSVDDCIKAWVKANSCPENPRAEERYESADDGTTVRKTCYGPGKEGAEVILYAIDGGGHTWPGRDPAMRLLGRSTRDISANDLIWDFFLKHPRK